MKTPPDLHRIVGRWDRQAIAQLRAEVARLDAENDDLRDQLYRMADCAQSWRDDALKFQMELCRLSDAAPGITVGGVLVVVPTKIGVTNGN